MEREIYMQEHWRHWALSWAAAASFDFVMAKAHADASARWLRAAVEAQS